MPSDKKNTYYIKGEKGDQDKYEDLPPSYEEVQKSHNSLSQTPQGNNAAPNVYYVKNQLVDISRADPKDVHPSYDAFRKNEAKRWSEGDAPKGRDQYKHGAPLSKGSVDRSKKTGGTSFPGSSGVTYNNKSKS